jgi:hypothetical protein
LEFWDFWEGILGMFILEKLKEYSFDLATVGRIGSWFGGGLIASFLAFPLILILRFFANITPYFFYWLLVSLFIFYVIIIFLAVNFISDRFPSEIVLDRIVGLTIAFWAIPIHWKLMVVSFFAFHLINFFRPFFFYKILEEKIEKFSFALSIIIGSIISGVLLNLFMRLVVWISG